MSKAETKYPLMLVWVKEHAEGVFEIIAPGCSFGIHPTTAEGTAVVPRHLFAEP